MEKIADILEEIKTRVAAALALDPSRVLLSPRPNELPDDTDPYAAIRAELDQGRAATLAYDDVTLRVDVAAYVADVPAGDERERRRMAVASGVHARLTPCPVGTHPAISGWDRPVMTQALIQPDEDVPEQLFIGMTFESMTTLARGGYAG